MACEIVWTEIAKEDFEILIKQNLEFSSVAQAEKLVDQTYERLETLRRFPESGQRSEKIHFVRRFLINPKTAIFYRIMGEQVVLLNLIDLRSDPKNNPY